ncbi:MAG: hypothetical protein AAF998_11110 [Bacteroidota bacterium]
MAETRPAQVDGDGFFRAVLYASETSQMTSKSGKNALQLEIYSLGSTTTLGSMRGLPRFC